MEHTKEPWSIEPCGGSEDYFDVMSDGGWFIATTHDGVNGESNAEANARRIFAAVNACAEISTATLENAGLDVGNELVKLRQQRDDLLAASQAVIDRWDTPLWKDVPATAEFINELRAAVASVKP